MEVVSRVSCKCEVCSKQVVEILTSRSQLQIAVQGRAGPNAFLAQNPANSAKSIDESMGYTQALFHPSPDHLSN